MLSQRVKDPFFYSGIVFHGVNVPPLFMNACFVFQQLHKVMYSYVPLPSTVPFECLSCCFENHVAKVGNEKLTCV